MKKLLVCLLTLIMVISLLPASVLAEDETIRKAIQLGTSGIKDPVAKTNASGTYYEPSDYIYYGTDDTNPIKWRVLDADKTSNDEDGMFLLSESALGKSNYSENFAYEKLEYQGSIIQSWCNSFLTEHFSLVEQNATLATSTDDEKVELFNYPWYTNALSSDKLFPLSVKEYEQYIKNYSISTYEHSQDDYYLRSVIYLMDTYYPALVYDEMVYFYSPTSQCGVRPAFNLDTSTVLLISAKENGKSNEVGTLSKVNDANTNEWKLTLRDSGRTIKVSTSEVSVYESGGTVYINYSDANMTEYSGNEYVSALIANKDNEILYYGHIAGNSSSGRVSVDIPSLDAGEYTIKVFNEQCNDDLNYGSIGTDYASDFVDVKLNVVEEKAHTDHYVCGKADCSHTLEEHDKSNVWTGIDSLNEIEADGNYYLKKNVELESAWFCNYNVNLCLNGKNIVTSTGSYTIFIYPGKKLQITDCKEMAGTITYKGEYGQGINNEGEFVLWNGNISECKNYAYSAGIYNIGTFIMNGGSITNNTSENSELGGGVFNGKTFIMNGGTISNNSALNGAGVYNDGDSTFTMNGGTISDNSALAAGGGVYNISNFVMNGGNILSNSAKNTGGGVYNENTFRMTAGTISNNSSNYGGGVYNGGYMSYEGQVGGVITLSGNAVISNNTATYSGGGVSNENTEGTLNIKDNVSITDNKTTSSTSEDIYSRASGGGVYNTGSINMSGNVTISNNKKVDETNNVDSDEVINVLEGGMGNSASVGITGKLDQVVVSGTTNKKGFFSDNGYNLVKNGDNSLKLSDAQVHYICGDTECSEHGDEITWQKWTSNNSLPASGNYYLISDVSLSITHIITRGNTLNLCLNGNTIAGVNNYDVIEVENGASLNITDCQDIVGKITGGSNGVFNRGIFTL